MLISVFESFSALHQSSKHVILHPKKGRENFGYFRLRSTKYPTAAMIATATTAIVIANSELMIVSSASIDPPAEAAGPTVTQVVASELP